MRPGQNGRTRERAFEPGASVAVLGLGVSGVAAARLAARGGASVYASDVAASEVTLAAASALRSEGIDAEAGGHNVERILAADLVVVSPGIDPDSEIRRAVRASGVRTIAEVELAWRDLESRVIAITGTNGKTTTTGLTAHILRAGGLRATAAGNIGRPLSEIVLESPHPDWVAVELSSFQLADRELLRPDVGALLNLSPDHLDRYPDVASYYADKRRLFADAGPGSRWVLNADDPTVLDLAATAPGERFMFSLSSPQDPGAFLSSDGTLRARLAGTEEIWVHTGELRLFGPHNVANALAAGLACAVAGVSPDAIRDGLSSFEPLAHRLQPIGELDGVLWVNDSKATNVTATAVALKSFARPVVLLLGGKHKGEPYTGLAAHLQAGSRAVIAYGEAASLIVRDLSSAVPVTCVPEGFEAVVRTAAEIAKPGDVILLSPACSSYDMFANYQERGMEFVRAFQRLAARSGSHV